MAGVHLEVFQAEALAEAEADRGKETTKNLLNDAMKPDMIIAFEGVVCILRCVLNQQHGLWPGLT